jgi:hypothetical protein
LLCREKLSISTSDMTMILLVFQSTFCNDIFHMVPLVVLEIEMCPCESLLSIVRNKTNHNVQNCSFVLLFAFQITVVS